MVNLFMRELAKGCSMVKSKVFDDIDIRLLRELDVDPRLPVALLAQRLKLARGTVHARLAKLRREEVLRRHSTLVKPSALGRPVAAMVQAEIRQHQMAEAVAALELVPEVLECFAPAGDTDLLMRVVASEPDDLYRVSEAIRLCPGVVRTSTSVFLREVIPYRIAKLLEADQAAANEAGREGSVGR